MLLHLDFNSETPIYQQIRNQVVVGVAEGRLAPGERLPPSGRWRRRSAYGWAGS